MKSFSVSTFCGHQSHHSSLIGGVGNMLKLQSAIVYSIDGSLLCKLGCSVKDRERQRQRQRDREGLKTITTSWRM
jgi:hypothetical protein